MQFIEIAYASPVTEAESATEVTTEVAHPTDSGLLASLGINPAVFAWQTFNFALVACIIWYLILKPLTKKLTERQNLIEESLENAKRIQENLIQSEAKYQSRIDEAKVEANKILERATTEASQVADTMKEKAKVEIETLVDHAKNNIRIEKEEMVVALKAETAGLVVSALEKILAEKMDSKKDKEMIETMIEKLH